MLIEIVGMFGIALATATPEVPGETTLLEQADVRIEAVRKGDVRLRVLDADGEPLENVQVSVNKTHHEFLFGCNIYAFDGGKTDAERETYRQRFAELFNFATLGFYWRSYEPTEGQPRYDRTDNVLQWCESHNIVAKGHPLVWSNEAGVPKWLPDTPSIRLERAEARVRAIVGRYKGRITVWDVVNEPIHMRTFDDTTHREYDRLPVAEIVDYVDAALRWAHEADPEATLLVNEFNIMSTPASADRFWQLMELLKARNAPFDAIGMQAHEPRTDRFSLKNVVATLKRFTPLGVPVHITEFTPASSGETITGGAVAGTWTEEAQADYAVAFYRICFGHPAVEAITWWDLWDRHSWLPGGGMLRDDLTPKPVYNALHHLIHEVWHTKLETQTDSEGQAAFRGFYGTYDITVTDKAGNRLLQTSIRAGRGQQNVFTLKAQR